MTIRETSARGAQIVVTGSEGFVGRHVRAALERRGATTIGVDRPGTSAEIEVDLASPDFDPVALWDRIHGDVVSVVYMAAKISRSSSVDAAARTNLRLIAEAPVRLIEEGHRRGTCGHIVDCSTFKLFGPPRQRLIVAATHPRRPDPFSYGSAKALSERLLDIAAARAGFSFAVIHPTCVYGPGQHPHNAIPVFLSAVLRGEAPVVYGSGDSVRDDVYVSDLADVLVEAALQRKTGAYHAAGERARTVLEVAEACCRAAARVGARSDVEPRVSPHSAPKWWLDQQFDLAPTRREFGYEPTPLDVGLAAEAEWLLAGAPRETATFARRR